MKQTRSRILVEKERRSKVKLRKYARRIPDSAKFANILMQFDKPFRSEFYRRVAPHLKFVPLPLEDMIHES